MIRFLLLALLVAGPGIAADVGPGFPKPPAPFKPQPPAPKEDPAATINLTADIMYVAHFKVDGVLDYVPDLVSVNKEAIAADAPLRVRGRFADAPDKVETRTFKDGWLYTIEATTAKNADGSLKSGSCLLSFVPTGTTERNQIVRSLITVNAGPQPPPGPGPNPPAPTDPLFAKIQAAYTADQSLTKAADIKTLATLFRSNVLTPDNANFKTVGDLYAFMYQAGQTALPNPRLGAVRNAIADDNELTLSRVQSQPLTFDERAKWKSQFVRVAGLLDQIK